MRLILALLLLPLPATAEVVTVFAAASLGPPLTDIAEEWQEDTGHVLRLSLAGSSVLARQILSGAPADLFLSASDDWAAEVAAGRPPLAEVNLAGNTLVLIAAPDAADTTLERLADTLGEDRLAVALTDSVPAGQYARAALQDLGLWDRLAPRLAQADNVRAALGFVALGAAPYGIVYGSDAAGEPRVRVLAVLPPDSHPPIRYPALLLRDGAAAREFFDHLQGAAAREALRRAGFLPP